MDNDLKAVKEVKKCLKMGFAKVRYSGYRCVQDLEAGNEIIKAALRAKAPFLAGRLGSNEARVTIRYLKQQKYSEEEIFRITQHAGVFPREKSAIDSFAVESLSAIEELDLLGVWYVRGEGSLLRLLDSERTQLAPLRCLEPYYFKEPWSAYLESKRVLVVHPFKKAIELQYQKREHLFEGPMLPEFADLTVIQAHQTIAGQKSSFTEWSAALESMKAQMSRAAFDVAIIGAGAYGLPLAAHAKKMGKVALHTGGATQILFGIKGARWDEHPFISQLYNDHWIRPLREETPENNKTVEGGSYW